MWCARLPTALLLVPCHFPLVLPSPRLLRDVLPLPRVSVSLALSVASSLTPLLAYLESIPAAERVMASKCPSPTRNSHSRATFCDYLVWRKREKRKRRKIRSKKRSRKHPATNTRNNRLTSDSVYSSGNSMEGRLDGGTEGKRRGEAWKRGHGSS